MLCQYPMTDLVIRDKSYQTCFQETLKMADEIRQHINVGVYITVGPYPVDLIRLSEIFGREQAIEIMAHGMELAATLCEEQKCIAIGEIGLDYYRDYSPRDVQQTVFKEQLDMAREFEMPVVIHVRNAMEDALEILFEHRVKTIGGVLHCFPGDADDAREASKMNLMVSFGGSLTFKKSRSARVAAEVPLDQIILETDCPFITPEPFRGKRNQPLYVKYAYEALAKIKDIPLDTLQKTVDENARRLFNLGDGTI